MYRLLERVERTVVGSLYNTLNSLAEIYGMMRSVMYSVENLYEDIVPVII
jgi:hypothetical protein